MDIVPDEVLLMIFDRLTPGELLGAVSQVCKRWATLAAHRAQLIHREDQLQTLNRGVRGVRVLTRLARSELYKLLDVRNLRDITICSATPLPSECFQALAALEHLEHLDVFLHERLLDTSMMSTLVRLRSVVINEMISPGVLSALAVSERLEALHMYGRALYFPRRDLMKFLTAHRSQLRELTLRCTEVHDNAYAAIGQCDSLVSLQLYSCWLMRGAGALEVTRPPLLRRLHVTGARMVRAKGLNAFLLRLPPQLEELVLSVSAFSDKHISALENLTKLRVLELWRCRLSGEGVLALARTVLSLCILDLDILLTNKQIQELDKHPNLLNLRCLTDCSSKYVWPPVEVSKTNEDQEVKTQKLNVLNTNEVYSHKYFRGNGEGYRGSLFYYWTQKMHLHPAERKIFPGFDESEDFY
ncbi:unnamed protein product [Chilo suppressalis]|uniref:F-box domain-containing protein n=1 Tax=Chilo suppressalis TaxID=168631 RepID=A0ABN8B5K9_CHISP|nr:unnamed protein product [Chilo suppressalis]